jgi:hypothetical protein
MYPIVISASLVTPFKYWDGAVKEGILYGHDLYQLVQKFDINQRLKAYDEGCKIGDNNVRVCITVTKFNYTLWQSLRPLAPPQDSNLQALDVEPMDISRSS